MGSDWGSFQWNSSLKINEILLSLPVDCLGTWLKCHDALHTEHTPSVSAVCGQTLLIRGDASTVTCMFIVTRLWQRQQQWHKPGTSGLELTTVLVSLQLLNTGQAQQPPSHIQRRSEISFTAFHRQLQIKKILAALIIEENRKSPLEPYTTWKSQASSYMCFKEK